MTTATKPWDPVDHFDDSATVAAYLEAAFEDGDPALVAAAIGDVARARGMTRVAREAGVSRESLYRALSADGDPRLTTLLGVVKALGLQLKLVPASPAA